MCVPSVPEYACLVHLRSTQPLANAANSMSQAYLRMALCILQYLPQNEIGSPATMNAMNEFMFVKNIIIILVNCNEKLITMVN